MSHQAVALSKPRTQSMTIEHDSVVAIYESRAAAEIAIRPLSQSSFDMHRLSMIGKDYTTEEIVVGFLNTGDCMKAWARTGAFSGGLWGTLLGSALFVIPGIGPLYAAGPLVGQVIGAMDWAASEGMTALGAGLYSVGIPKASILTMESNLKSGKFIVIAHGSRSEVELSRTILTDAEHLMGAAHECCAQRLSANNPIS